MHPAIILKRSPMGGLGPVAPERIAASEVIWREEMTNRQYRRDDSTAWPPERHDSFPRYAFQTGERLHPGPVVTPSALP